jgi:3alpha(or 20beta)-hydroxysteroid dehydrogenase
MPVGKLDGKTAVVTGAARGMGAAHARILASEGARVAVCDVLDDAGRAVSDEIGGMYCHLDVADESAWEQAIDAVRKASGPPSILVNNAGIPSLNRVQDTPTDEWNRVLAVNLTGVFFGIRAVVESMRQAGEGVIVNISSDAGMTGMGNIAAYLASKWGVRGLTKAAALDLAHDRIRVVSVHPGIVRTPMGEGVDMDAIAKGQPIPRVGEPMELAKLVLFLVADATYCTGSEFVADGGHTAGIHLPL